ncbi:MAG: hypothetical protein COV66_04700 [Nitrospinae bacterium CG11_big_fil_rev_8_21_14_0_20_45_15]|nr:MAG: hypothetical protein COV66_04700 [Nitrospinae bacterium CG11_big_fil_rev_8_21_14_0_20_45_15]
MKYEHFKQGKLLAGASEFMSEQNEKIKFLGNFCKEHCQPVLGKSFPFFAETLVWKGTAIRSLIQSVPHLAGRFFKSVDKTLSKHLRETSCQISSLIEEVPQVKRLQAFNTRFILNGKFPFYSSRGRRAQRRIA